MEITAVTSVDVYEAPAMDKDTFGAQVVTKTLDYMNSNMTSGSTNTDYDFQSTVLSAAYTGQGMVFDITV